MPASSARSCASWHLISTTRFVRAIFELFIAPIPVIADNYVEEMGRLTKIACALTEPAGEGHLATSQFPHGRPGILGSFAGWPERLGARHNLDGGQVNGREARD